MYFPTSASMIEFLILAKLHHHDSYGYELAQSVKQLANIKESTLYPILKRLETSHYLTTYSQVYQGRKRKYYQLTDSGRQQLSQLQADWRLYTQIVDRIIKGEEDHD